MLITLFEVNNFCRYLISQNDTPNTKLLKFILPEISFIIGQVRQYIISFISLSSSSSHYFHAPPLFLGGGSLIKWKKESEELC